MGNKHARGIYAELRGDTEFALTPDAVESFQCTGRESNAPDIFRSEIYWSGSPQTTHSLK